MLRGSVTLRHDERRGKSVECTLRSFKLLGATPPHPDSTASRIRYNIPIAISPSPHAISPPSHARPDRVTPHHIAPHHTIPHHTAPHHTTPHHTTPHHTTPHHTTPHHSTAHHTTAQHTTPQHTTPRHTTPHHNVFHHAFNPFHPRHAHHLGGRLPRMSTFLHSQVRSNSDAASPHRATTRQARRPLSTLSTL